MAKEIDYGTSKKIVKKEVSYLGRDFSDIRQNLIEFAKTYFPNSYNDFNEASPGMMFIEMAAYVGDVLNYYVDNQFRETMLQHAEEKKNILSIAQSYGYKPKLATPATVELTVEVDVPATTTGTGASAVTRPDFTFAGVVEANSSVLAGNGVEYNLLDAVNFKVSSSLDPMDVETLHPATGNLPTNFRLRKKVLAQSGKRAVETFAFTSAKKFDKIVLKNAKPTEVISVTDSDSNKYYEVPFLAQDTVFDSVENTSLNDPSLSTYQNDTPYLLKLIKTARRFTTYVTENDKMELRFGAGVSSNADEDLIPNPDNVGSSLGFGVSRLDEAFDPSNFLKTQTFGLAPSNTTLTVEYTYGGAIEHNVPSNDITRFNRLTYTLDKTNLNQANATTSEQSLRVFNELPSSGGSSGENIIEIKQNAGAYFNAQNRAVTRQDYITRCYNLPQKFGNIAKAYIVQDEQLEVGQLEVIDGLVIQVKNDNVIPNPLALNLYCLGYDTNRKLVALNTAVKRNLKTYLSQYRVLTDAINIKDGYVINVGVRFAITTKRGTNANVVLRKAIARVREFFRVEKWQINQPIILSDLAYQISLVDGVVSVIPPKDNNPNNDLIVIENKNTSNSGASYSANVYDLQAATKDGVIYPSMDPAIFEIKFPNTDIEGRVVGDM